MRDDETGIGVAGCSLAPLRRRRRLRNPLDKVGAHAAARSALCIAAPDAARPSGRCRQVCGSETRNPELPSCEFVSQPNSFFCVRP